MPLTSHHWENIAQSSPNPIIYIHRAG